MVPDFDGALFSMNGGMHFGPGFTRQRHDDNALDGTVPLRVARAFFDAAPKAPFFVALTALIA
jgi:hypothetical protein